MSNITKVFIMVGVAFSLSYSAPVNIQPVSKAPAIQKVKVVKLKPVPTVTVETDLSEVEAVWYPSAELLP